jgi:ABC-type sugar transport system ATPase subunit
MTTPVLELRGLRKEYDGVVAANAASFELRAGEIVGLVGKNGAGKSTVIKMLAGAVRPDAGEILIDGEPCDIGSPHQAFARGLGFMFQEPEIVPRTTVAENVMLGASLPRRAGVLMSWRDVNERAAALLAELDRGIDPRDQIEELSVAQQRLVMIARALHRRARVLVLDEPTTSLTDREIVQLHDVCRRLRDGGGSVVYVSHRLGEVFDLTDRVVVMRDGRVVDERPTAEHTHASLVDSITGGGVAAAVERGGRRATIAAQAPDTQRMRVRGLVREGGVGPISFDLHRGEILGLAGLVGAGRTELLRLIFGADRASGGTVEVDGRPVTLHGPRDAMAAGIALLPEDRRHQGLIMSFGVRENATLASLRSYCSRAPFFPSRRREREVTDGLVRRLDVVTRGREELVRLLSGGNQQKVVIAKWLARDSNILMFDEPSVGIDVAAKTQLYGLIEELAATGKAVIVVSSEFAELVSVCHRVLVLREGAHVETLRGEEITEQAIVAACYGTAGGPGGSACREGAPT